MPASLASYADFLKLLVSLGNKLPQALAIITAIYEKVKELAQLFAPAAPGPTSGTLELVNVTAQEGELEAQIGAIVVGQGAQGLFDGSRLRQLFAFAKEHPEFLTLLLSLLKG